MENTDNLALPYIMPNQAQKHVTHNEALRMLDAIVQLAVLDRGLSEPPASPASGARYIVGANPTGAWSGHDDEVAAWQDGAWAFYPPATGWFAWVQDESRFYVYSQIRLDAEMAGGTGVNPAPLVGVNTTADAANRLAVSSPASLFNHEGDDHQLKINKASAADTASLLFQTGFAAHAEFGLTGDDDWHVKVSPDGSAWHEAIVVDRASGAVTFPNTVGGGGGRELLSAPRTYYVDGASGNDGNDGLTSGTAFATIQKAVDTAASLDTGIHNVTIDVASGTYPDPVVLKSLVGAGEVILVGDEGTPGNVVISVPAGAAIAPAAAIIGTYRVRGFRLATAGSGGSAIALQAIGAGCAVYFSNLEFGPAGGAHIKVERLGLAEAEGDYAIVGGADRHWWASNEGMVSVVGRTINISNTPAFANAFAYANVAGLITCAINSYNGPATGTRYEARENSTIRTNGATLPGDGAGIAADDGVYT
jgi:hypothetical protein